MWAAHKVKILSALLSLSLLANIGMGGMVAGKQFAGWAWHPRHSAENIMRAAKKLPQEQQSEIKQIVSRYGKPLRESGESILRQRQVIRTLASQDTLDKDKLVEALAELRTLTGKTQALGHEMIMEIIDKVPANERAALFERRKKDRKEKGKRHEP